jgi:hypothetical protein
MKLRGGRARCCLQTLAAAGLLAAPSSALAFSFGIGLEGGATLSSLTSVQVWPDLGLILTQRFELGPVDLTLWEDVNLPVVYDGEVYYFPIDIGLRVGLPGPLFRPYVGLLVNDSRALGIEPNSEYSNEGALTDVPGLGGDVGFDLAVAFLRFGFELRAYETLISPAGGSYGDGFALQGLLSVRAEL